jgi:hypothetical protein
MGEERYDSICCDTYMWNIWICSDNGNIKYSIFNADYLYIKDVNENFNAAFSYMNNGNEYYTGQLYEISDVNGEIKITLVNG